MGKGNKLEPWSPSQDKIDAYSSVDVDTEIVRGAGPITKITWMVLSGPASPILAACATISVMALKGVLTEYYFTGVIVLALAGVYALVNRGRDGPTT